MELVPGDMLKLGESSRLYRLDWVPISFAYEVNDPFVPQLDALDIVDENTQGADQDENHMSRENELGRDLTDEIEAIRWQSSEEDLGLSVQETAAEVENTLSPEMFNDENEVSEMFNDENEISGSQLLSLGASFSGDEEAEEEDNEGNGLGETMEDQPLCDEATTPPRPEDEVEVVSSSEICNDENEFYSSQQGCIPLAEIVEASEINSEKRLGMKASRSEPAEARRPVRAFI